MDLKDAIVQLIEFGRQAAGPQMVPGGNVPYVMTAQGPKPMPDLVFNEHNERPERIKGTVQVFDPASFCEYFKLFSDEESRIFADETRSKVLAVLDYHQSVGTDTSSPRWGQHRLDLTLRYSQEWTEWTAQNGKKSTQMDFAEFLEDHAPDIVSPDAATMLEVARSLSAKTDVDFSSAIRQANGSVNFKYNEQVKGTYGNGQFDVPEAFTIAIPVYLGHERVPIQARLRYRLNSGKLTFWFDLLRAPEVERRAFLAARSAIADTLSVSIINGVPA